ncbi:hypothetical protein J437_LFUL018014 [Ladona fulva]|uniref:L antigen family member 3 n=1 Tax=Ladona fulva TaxID=123851 RepID=A0A8K0PAN9_LADFU|nr:hypothetical protein J437_LFUL018014 [Ladona fulva]
MMMDMLNSMNIPFPSTRDAAIAYDVLRVDAEPKRSGVTKTLIVENNSLKVTFSSKGAKQLRVAVHSFVDYLVLISETMAEFGQARTQMSEHSPAPTPSRAVYGFAFYLAACTGFSLYMLWGFALPLLPNSVKSLPFLSQLPQPYWAVAIPIHACVALAMFAFFIYPGINLMMTPPPDDLRVIQDSHSHYVPSSSQPVGGIPPVRDLHISEVCRILYMKSET